MKKVEIIPFPETEATENFEFEAVTDTGTLKFIFKWFNSRWNCWVTLPDSSVRQAGVYPNVVNWTGSRDYGLVFVTSLSEINFNSLFLTEMCLIQWA